MSKKILLAFTVLVMSISLADAVCLKPDTKAYRFGSNTQYLKPKVDKTTKMLIKNYKAEPTEENLSALRGQVEANYDKAIAKKKAKLVKLEQKSTNQTKIGEMREVLNMIEKDREERIFWTLNRYTNNKLVSDIKASEGDYLPLNEADLSVLIARYPVTNAQYAEFIKDTSYKMPAELILDDTPVTNVSYYDALIYCDWLTRKDKEASYRLPSEKEWKLYKKHTSKTKADKGYIWEWTTTSKNSAFKIVKGGSCQSKKLSCKMKKHELKNSSLRYADTGFRVIRVK